jgi:hypothetical protein
MKRAITAAAAFVLAFVFLMQAKDEDLDLPVTLIACGSHTKDGAQHHIEE